MNKKYKLNKVKITLEEVKDLPNILSSINRLADIAAKPAMPAGMAESLMQLHSKFIEIYMQAEKCKDLAKEGFKDIYDINQNLFVETEKLAKEQLLVDFICYIKSQSSQETIKKFYDDWQETKDATETLPDLPTCKRFIKNIQDKDPSKKIAAIKERYASILSGLDISKSIKPEKRKITHQREISKEERYQAYLKIIALFFQDKIHVVKFYEKHKDLVKKYVGNSISLNRFLLAVYRKDSSALKFMQEFTTIHHADLVAIPGFKFDDGEEAREREEIFMKFFNEHMQNPTVSIASLYRKHEATIAKVGSYMTIFNYIKGLKEATYSTKFINNLMKNRQAEIDKILTKINHPLFS